MNLDDVVDEETSRDGVQKVLAGDEEFGFNFDDSFGASSGSGDGPEVPVPPAQVPVVVVAATKVLPAPAHHPGKKFLRHQGSSSDDSSSDSETFLPAAKKSKHD